MIKEFYHSSSIFVFLLYINIPPFKYLILIFLKISSLAGTRVWLDIHKYVEVLCELTYYSLTTLSLRQTLGEEYTGVLQVGRNRQRLPNAPVSMIFLRVCRLDAYIL